MSDDFDDEGSETVDTEPFTGTEDPFDDEGSITVDVDLEVRTGGPGSENKEN